MTCASMEGVGEKFQTMELGGKTQGNLRGTCEQKWEMILVCNKLQLIEQHLSMTLQVGRLRPAKHVDFG